MKPQTVTQGFCPEGLKIPKIAESREISGEISGEVAALCREGAAHIFNP